MDEPVGDGIGQSRVRDPSMPVGHRHLSDDHGGVVSIAVIQDFEQVSGLG